MMVTFKSIFTILAIFSLFFGLIATLAYDLLLIIARPFNPEPWKVLALDIGRTVLNSQLVISDAVKEFATAESFEYKTFLLSRIIAGSLLTLFLIWLFYKIQRWFVEAPSVSSKILIIITSVVLVWFVSIVAGIFLGRIEWIPFKGWIDLATHREEIIKFLLEQYRGS